MFAIVSILLLLWVFCCRAQECANQSICLMEDPIGKLLQPFFTNCTENASEVEYWLYTPNTSVELRQGDFIDKNKPVNILIHGWAGNRNEEYIQVIKRAYFDRYGWSHTIIIVEYGMYVMGSTFPMYANAYCSVPAISENVGSFLCNLCTTNGINPSNIHIVGHSLGGQVSGFAGQYFQQKCKSSIGRITGLDPANPGFVCPLCNNYRLDSTDAQFVDIIHTDIFIFGTPLLSGDVDFYVNNGGPFQPGCCNYSDKSIISLVENLFEITRMIVDCSHQRSCYIFAESITLNDFLATSCWLGGDLPVECLYVDKVYMGQYCTTPQDYNSYYVSTKAQYPYGYGPKGPLN